MTPDDGERLSSFARRTAEGGCPYISGAAEAAHFIDGQLALTFVLMGIVFLAAQLSLGYIVWKYRQTPSSPPVLYSHGNTKLEILWTVLTTIICRIESDGQPGVGQPAL
ncbi:MAG: cytochrome c oxidase subunit II transmembrane domain-containing protein [Candidatus Sulfotelmatobacter sp.]